MLINWFTLVAQIINFLILLWLLNKFLYRPVLKALDEREARIASTISDAESVKLNAMKELDEYSGKKVAIDKEKDSIIQASRSAAEQERIQIIDNAKNTALQLIDNQNIRLYNERNVFYKNASEELITQIVRITEKSITDLSDTTLETLMVKKCIDNITLIPENELKMIPTLLQNCNNQILVQTSSPLDQTVFSQLQESLSSIFGSSVTLHWKSASHLLCGIELIIDTYKLSWNAHDYIQKAFVGITESTTTDIVHETGTIKESVQ
jgi:F-type H+-transporting ATPase subunit b